MGEWVWHCKKCGYTHNMDICPKCKELMTQIYREEGLPICKNCRHYLWFHAGNWEHYTRYYISHGMPYSTIKCHAKDCDCKNPEPIYNIGTKKEGE